jgi:hypothetical protein
MATVETDELLKVLTGKRVMFSPFISSEESFEAAVQFLPDTKCDS